MELTKEILSTSAQYVFASVIPMPFLWIAKFAIVQRNLGEEQDDRLDDKNYLKNFLFHRDAQPYIFDNKLLYGFLRLLSKINIVVILFLPVYLHLYINTSPDAYLLRRVFEIFQGVFGFFNISVSLYSFAFIEDKKPRMIKSADAKEKYEAEYSEAKEMFLQVKNDESIPVRKKLHLLHSMEQNLGLLIDYHCRLAENTKQADSGELDRLFRCLQNVEQECITLNPKNMWEYDIRYYSQCLWVCSNITEREYHAARELYFTEVSQKKKEKYLYQMEEQVEIVGDDLYDAIVVGAKLSYASALQRENMEQAYALYIRLLDEIRPHFSKKDLAALDHNGKLYQELLEYRRKNIWIDMQ